MSGGDDRATEILAAARERLDRGEHVDAEVLAREHPDLADDLRRRFAALQRLDRLFGRSGVPVPKPPAPPSLVGRALGAYRLTASLGTGGMGAVYEATVEGRAPGLAKGERVAVKVVHPHLLARDGFFRRFLREAEIGRRVRHENVVRTLDADAVIDGADHAHFLVMEYVEGQTLRALLDELGRVPEELCRHVGREAAKALAAIHAVEAVHRDLKPENFLITRDHVVKVMDLGVARVAEEDLSQTGAFVGSVRYAAPEQFRGKAASIDGRADLYSLGLVLYELATGAHPFAGDDFQAVMRRQLTEVPRAAGEVNPQLSPFFEEVLRTLLAKDPEKRFASAEDLLIALSDGEKSPWWHERAIRIRAETRRPLRRIKIPRETALYGRESEISLLRSVYDKANAGDGQVVFVEGEAGIGKSRLVDEFVALLQREGEDVHFLFGSYPPGGAATASGAFSTAYREHFGEETLEDALREALPVTPLLVPAFAALLKGDAAPSGAEALTKDSLQTCFVHATRSLAKERTTIVLIDDLHFAPEEGRGLFASLALATPGHRILLVGTARPGTPQDWLVNVERTAHVTRLPLARLGPKDLVRLLADTLRSEHLAEELCGRIAAKSDGNPFFVFEILRGLREGQFLTQRPDGTWVTTQILRDIQVPSTIQDLVCARIGDLDAEDKDLLDVASCLGFEFDAAVIADALGEARLPVLRRLARIEARHRLVRSSGEGFVFDHHQVQETLNAALPPPLAREYHAAIASAIEAGHHAGSIDPDDVDGAVCVDLAEHFLAAGLDRRAVRYIGAALSHLERGSLNDHAVALADRALAAPGLLEGRARFETLLRKAVRLDFLGRRDAQRTVLGEAMVLADSDGDPALRARVRNHLGWCEMTVVRAEAAWSLLSEALDLARRAGDKRTEAAASSYLGNVLSSRSQFADAQTWHQAALSLASDAGDREGEVRARLNLGNALTSLGRYAEATEQFERGVELARAWCHRRGEAALLGSLGRVHHLAGRHEDAQAHLERSLALAREIGDRWGECFASSVTGNVLWSFGRFLEARKWHERSLALSLEVGDRRGQVVTEGNLATDLLALGHLADAQAQCERHLALARELGNRATEAHGLCCLGSLRILLGDHRGARLHLERSLEISRPIGARVTEGFALDGLAEAYDERGDTVGAMRLAREALALRREIGNGDGVVSSLIRDADLRRRAGDLDGASAELEEVIALSGAQDRKASTAVAAALLAGLRTESSTAPEAALVDAGGALACATAARVRFLLWQATRDRDHLVEAKRLLDFLVEHAPPEDRASMLTNVRLHREIVAAAREQGLA